MAAVAGAIASDLAEAFKLVGSWVRSSVDGCFGLSTVRRGIGNHSDEPGDDCISLFPFLFLRMRWEWEEVPSASAKEK